MHPENQPTPTKVDEKGMQFFAVCLPKGTDASLEGTEHSVFTDRQEALRLLKQHKGARFKAFASLEEANRFASQSPESTSSEDVPGLDAALAVGGEKPSPFRAPKPQELVQLRKAIEGGDADHFRCVVWSNPRYLISSGDTPTILQEGFRYNALHVAAKAKQPELAKLVLEAVEDPTFMELLYPDDSQSSRQQRIAFLVDLYLNTPDKGLCETPLHFASKFGAASVVKVLTSYPTCEREKKNKYDQTPLEVVCSRYGSSDKHLKEEIESYLQDRFFIPILRTDDDSSPPIVGEPWSPQKQGTDPLPYIHPRLVEKPYSVSAYAGPMTPMQASEFHRLLKMTPRHLKRPGSPGCNVFGSEDVRLSDYEKGLERVARQLAARMKVRWQERWSFLETYSDLSQPSGLGLLESHLEQRWNELREKTNEQDGGCISDESFVTASGLDDQHDISFASSGLTSLCQAFQHFHLEDGDSAWLVSSPVSKSPDHPKLAPPDHHNPRSSGKDTDDALLRYLHQTCAVIANQITMDLIKLAETSSRSSKVLRESFLQPAKCLHGIILNVRRCGLPDSFDLECVHSRVVAEIGQLLSQEDNEVVRAFFIRSVNLLRDDARDRSDSSDDESYKGRWNVPHAKKCLFPSVVHEHADCLVHLLACWMSKERDGTRCRCRWSFEDQTESPTDETAPNSNTSNDSLTERDKSNVSTSSTGGYVTPPSYFSDLSVDDDSDGEPLFIMGSEPTKTDLDILRAIETVDVDPMQFPRVYRWRQLVKSFPQRLAESWPSPSIKKLRRRECSSPPPSPILLPSNGAGRASPLNF